MSFHPTAMCLQETFLKENKEINKKKKPLHFIQLQKQPG